MFKIRLLTFIAISQLVAFGSSKLRNQRRYHDDVPSAEELDARLERIQNILTAALEDRAILRHGEDPSAQENSDKIVLTEEERKHIKNILSGVEEADPNSEDIDKLNAIFSALNDKFDNNQKTKNKKYYNAEKARNQNDQPQYSRKLKEDNDVEDITVEEE